MKIVARYKRPLHVFVCGRGSDLWKRRDHAQHGQRRAKQSMDFMIKQGVDSIREAEDILWRKMADDAVNGKPI